MNDMYHGTSTYDAHLGHVDVARIASDTRGQAGHVEKGGRERVVEPQLAL